MKTATKKYINRIFNFILVRIIKSPITSILGSLLIICGVISFFMDKDWMITGGILSGGTTLLLMKDSHIGIYNGNNNQTPQPPDNIGDFPERT